MSLQDRCHDHVVTLGLTTLRPLSLRFPVPLLRLVLSSFSVLVWFARIVGMHPLSYFHGIPTPPLLLRTLGPSCTAYMQLHSVSRGGSVPGGSQATLQLLYAVPVSSLGSCSCSSALCMFDVRSLHCCILLRPTSCSCSVVLRHV